MTNKLEQIAQSEGITAEQLSRCLAKLAGGVEPVAWIVTTEMQDGRQETYPLIGRFKDVKCSCDFGEPIPLYTGEALAAVQQQTAEAIDTLQAEKAALLSAMIEARQALQFANDSPGGGISDTIWMMHRPETLFDFMDAAIANAKGAAA